MDQEGLRAARAVARWEIGDASWADLILYAYFNPEEATEALEAQKHA